MLGRLGARAVLLSWLAACIVLVGCADDVAPSGRAISQHREAASSGSWGTIEAFTFTSLPSVDMTITVDPDWLCEHGARLPHAGTAVSYTYEPQGRDTDPLNDEGTYGTVLDNNRIRVSIYPPGGGLSPSQDGFNRYWLNWSTDGAVAESVLLSVDFDHERVEIGAP